MKEKLKDRKTILIVGLFLVLVAVLGVSYAFFSARILGNEDAKENIVKAGTMELTFTDGDDAISLLNAKPSNTGSKTFKVENTGTLEDEYTYNIKLSDVETTFKGQDLKYTLQETESNYEIAKGDPIEGYINVGTVNNGTIYLKTGINTKSKDIHYYTLKLEFQELDINQNYNQGATFSGKVNIDVEKAEGHVLSYTDYCGGMDDLASCMLEYANKFVETVATDDPDANARFMGADPNNYIYFNCADPEHPTSDTCELWRIIGSFNDVDLAAGGTNNLVKIIRADNLAKDANIQAADMTAQIEAMRQEFEEGYEQMKDEYCPGMEKEECFKFIVKMEMGVDPDDPIMYGLSWDYRATEKISSGAYNYTSNNWVDSSLMKTLNEGYESFQMNGNGTKVSNSLYWNRTKGTCWSVKQNGESYDPTVDCDFSNTGLRITTHDMIENVKWHLGGSSSYSDSFAAQSLYKAERGTASYDGQATTWNGKVALMYPSDYYYATSGNSQGTLDRNACLTDEEGWYDDSGQNIYSDCFGNDWLFDSSNYQWTLTPHSATSNGVLFVFPVGGVDGSVAYFPYAVRPSLYLNSRVSLMGGVGTKTNPYVIKSVTN